MKLAIGITLATVGTGIVSIGCGCTWGITGACISAGGIILFIGVAYLADHNHFSP